MDDTKETPVTMLSDVKTLLIFFPLLCGEGLVRTVDNLFTTVFEHSDVSLTTREFSTVRTRHG